MPLAVVNTNVNKGGIPKDFMEKLTDFIVATLSCEQKVNYVMRFERILLNNFIIFNLYTRRLRHLKTLLKENDWEFLIGCKMKTFLNGIMDS